MSEPKFQRFSPFHRVLHWLIALPYLALLISGAIILLHHVGWMHALPLGAMTKLHRWIGVAFAVIVLQLLLAAFVGGYWRSIARDLRDWLTPRPRDLLWLICVPLNALLPRQFPLPPAGRFNAGQKLHGLFILVAVNGFIVTGLTMILVPGWLTVWRIHVWLFCGAIAFLSLHLFLGLINPPTRRALGGIFTGNVSRAYVEEHHPLVLSTTSAKHVPHAAVSIRAMILTAIIAAVPLFVWWLGPGHTIVHATTIAPWKPAMISPGPLVSAHSAKISAENCVACHTRSGPVTNSACLTCHAEIARALEQKVGYHGQLKGDCVACHTEHLAADADLRNFDKHAFNHDLAQFKLNGSHRSLNCDQCHRQHSPTPGETRFIGLRFSKCTDCHANPHPDMPAADCTRCHSEQGWKGRDLLFVHNRDSSFKLDAIHSTLSCVSCHRQPGSVLTFHDTPSSCVQCHTQIADAIAGKIGSLILKADPHDGRIACNDCHLPQVRSETPEQYATECARCHGTQYRTLFFNWQKSLDEREQSARLSLKQHNEANPQATKQWSDLLNQAHVAGMHNTQGAIEAFEKVSR